jgi:hypothetical protein
MVTEITEGTPVCWSVSRQLRGPVARTGVLHMQGYYYGMVDKSLCGYTYNGDALWDFGVEDYPPSEFKGCVKCMARYRRWARFGYF